MKYKKIFKWEIFAGFAVVLAISFILINFMLVAVYRNFADKELSNRLRVIGESIEKNIDPIVFYLTPDEKLTSHYVKNMKHLDAVKDSWMMEIAVITTGGKTCMTTSNRFINFETFVLGIDNVHALETTVPGKNGYEKTYFHPFDRTGSLSGYIVMRLTGEKALPYFSRADRTLFILLAIVFGIAMIIAFILSYLLTRRIEYTAKQMDRISKGKDAKIKVSWFDELSYLQEQINIMVSNLKEMEEARLKEIQIVAMGLAHEIKNPAAAIFNLAELAERGPTPR